ncbi:DUF5724 domain-containing protein [Agromyces arachidis]|uniref:DUF5724 domain-containing protein n=1 Tax=Agromyces arachidis TaxID=766966 RepID=UPI004055C6BF
MLSATEAHEELERRRVSQRGAQRITVRRVFAPPLARALAEAVNDRQSDPAPIAAELDDLSSAKRAKVLRAISPALGHALAGWWDWARRAPYQTGWTRRAYRSAAAVDSRPARFEHLALLLDHAARYPEPLAWHARWLVHLGGHLPLGQVLAAAINDGDAEVRAILVDSARARHPISGPSRQGHIALLSSADPGDWDVTADLLAAAGRAEGLRQTILEAADLGHPSAFARIVDVVLDRDLSRFAGTVRAAGVWLGDDFDVRRSGELAAALRVIRERLDRPADAAELVGAGSSAAYLGLWASAFRDARAAIPLASAVLRSELAGDRLAAARLLADLALPAAGEALVPALRDESLAVYAAAVSAWPMEYWQPKQASRGLDPEVRAALLDRVASLGRTREVDTGVVGARTEKIGASHAADVVVTHSPTDRLEPEILRAASADGRQHAARRYAADPVAHRTVLFELLDDRSSVVRGTAQGALSELAEITEPEAEALERALARKTADVRTTALSLLGTLPADRLAASISRLSAGTAEQRKAAEELRGQSSNDDASVDRIPASLAPPPSERTPAARPAAPQSEAWRRYHAGCALIHDSLAAWIDEHADVEVQTYHGVEMLANVRWLSPATAGTLPLAEILEPWWERILPSLTDGGVELALLFLADAAPGGWADEVRRKVLGRAPRLGDGSRIQLRGNLIAALAAYAWRPSWTETVIDLLDEAASALPLRSLVGPKEVMARRGIAIAEDRWGGIAQVDARDAFPELFQRLHRLVAPDSLSDDQLRRWWSAARFLDEPEGAVDRWNGPSVEVALRQRFGGARTGVTALVADQPFRLRPAPMLLATAFERGAATRADVVDALVVPTVGAPQWGLGRWEEWAALRELTSLRPEPWASGPGVQAVVEEVRRAVVEHERQRGDLPTACTGTASALRSAYGAEGIVQVLASLGTRPLTRGYAWTESRESSLSHLVRIHHPRPDDDPEAFARLVAATDLGERRIIEAGVYAPQWARLIEAHLGWPGYESAVWWLHAHTKDESWSVDREIRAAWESEVGQRTPLDGTDLVRGAADVAWFRAMHDEIGAERFEQVLLAAKYASTSGGHKRAELFANALLGRTDEAELLARIEAKRNQDAVRALGLLPLPDGDTRTLLARYELLRGFVASDRSSGSQRRASETTAVEVGMENLARTAGYRDPQRLIWAMEAAAVADLADGGASATDGDLVVTLDVDATGAPRVTAARAGAPLKSIPAASRKHPEVAALQARATSLRKQASRMRRSLEDACILGDVFDRGELDALAAHPILSPMLSSLVLVDSEGVAGFLSDEGASFTGPDGAKRRIAGGVRVAHPVDLLASGEWPDFQHVLMSTGVRQPFKQAFRELYTPSAGERDEAGTSSRRYAGHQLDARRAGGIFASRGWISDFQAGFSRTFHREKLTVWCRVSTGWGTPAEVEDATVDDVTFHPAGDWLPMKLDDVPPRVFSEAMRDLDLVVSVAHASGIDPEASESSVEMRGRLVDETAQLLGLSNVEVGGHHARVKGKLGTYTIHLGSGVVHRVPGNAVCIVPVSAQHRGRVFLPFADDDPRTAEIVAKAVLLARDDRITDPTIVEQLVRPGHPLA